MTQSVTAYSEVHITEEMKRGRQQRRVLTLLRFILLLIVVRQGLSQITSAGSGQAQALLDFKHANGNNSRTLESWANGTDFCTNWEGVTCYSHSRFHSPVQYVQAVRLRDAGLVGQLSRSLGNLTSLGRLELSGNSITGPIPVWLSSLKGLKYFKLDNNLLGGSIPQWLGNMSKLQEVSMANNPSQGEIPSGVFTNMSSLRTLVFSNNSLTGPIPSDLDIQLNSSLQVVLLSENRLTGSIPNSIASSQSLLTVNISKNSFTGELPQLWNTSSLESLDCSSNNLGGTIPQSLFIVPNLHFLNLANNSFIGKVTQNVSCRFGESAFRGNVGLIVEPCPSGSSPVYPLVLAPDITSSSPSLTTADYGGRVRLMITVFGSVVAGAIVTVLVAKLCLPSYIAWRRRQQNPEIDLETKGDKNLILGEQFLQASPGRDRMEAADGTIMSGAWLTKNKSSGIAISSSRQSENLKVKETFNSDFMKSPTRTPNAHSSKHSYGRTGGCRWVREGSSTSSSTEPLDIDEYTARHYTETMYVDLLDRVMSSRESSLGKGHSRQSS